MGSCEARMGWPPLFLRASRSAFLAAAVAFSSLPGSSSSSSPASDPLPGLICESCQVLASIALKVIRSSHGRDVYVALREVLISGSDSHDALSWSEKRLGSVSEHISDRCQRLLATDRIIVRRLAAKCADDSTSLSWHLVVHEFCVQKLRCREDAIWDSAEPWAASSVSAGAVLQTPRSELPPSNPVAQSTPSANVSMTLYEEMLLEFGQKQGEVTQPSPAKPEQSKLRAAPRPVPSATGLASSGRSTTGSSLASGTGLALQADDTPKVPKSSSATNGAHLEKVDVNPCEAPGGMCVREDSTIETANIGDIQPGRSANQTVVKPEVQQDSKEIDSVLPEDPLNPSCKAKRDSYRDLMDIRIVVVVFVGRRDRLRILLRYLERDLRRNGGVIDNVILAIWQASRRDLSFIEKISQRDSETFQIRDFSEQKWGPARLGADPSTNRMVRLYQSLDEPSTLYLKIDDDVVYVAPHAVAELVREKRRDRCLFASSNVVNHAIMSSLHQDRGAHRGFWPPDKQLENPHLRLAWRKHSEVNTMSQFEFERFPASKCVAERWDCAALVHESFLDRAADNTLCAFDFGWHDFNRAGYREHKYIHGSVATNVQYWSAGARWSTNFFAFYRDDLAAANWSMVYGKGDDEEEFTGPLAERRDRHSCAIGSALSVHFSYGSQEQGLMANTGLLKRYEKLSRRLSKAWSRSLMPPLLGEILTAGD